MICKSLWGQKGVEMKGFFFLIGYFTDLASWGFGLFEEKKDEGGCFAAWALGTLF